MKVSLESNGASVQPSDLGIRKVPAPEIDRGGARPYTEARVTADRRCSICASMRMMFSSIASRYAFRPCG